MQFFSLKPKEKKADIKNYDTYKKALDFCFNVENGINNFVKWFNKDFVVISPTKWRNYSRNLIYDIELENLFGEYIFTITIKWKLFFLNIFQ